MESSAALLDIKLPCCIYLHKTPILTITWHGRCSPGCTGHTATLSSRYRGQSLQPHQYRRCRWSSPLQCHWGLAHCCSAPHTQTCCQGCSPEGTLSCILDSGWAGPLKGWTRVLYWHSADTWLYTHFESLLRLCMDNTDLILHSNQFFSANSKL